MKLIKLGIVFCLITIFAPLGAGNQEDWLATKSRHFIVYYQEGVDDDFLDETIYYAEKYYNDITYDLGFRRYDYWLWEKRGKIYLYKDQASYVKATNMPPWSGGRAIYQPKIIETFPWAKGFFTHLLPHELGHIIFREFIGTQAQVPLWFEEGVASSQEALVQRKRRQAILIEALDDSSLISLEQLSAIDVRTQEDQNLVNLFYAQGESVVRFLIERYGSYGFLSLCRGIRDKKDFMSALHLAFPRYNNFKELNDDWVYYLKTTFSVR